MSLKVDITKRRAQDVGDNVENVNDVEETTGMTTYPPYISNMLPSTFLRRCVYIDGLSQDTGSGNEDLVVTDSTIVGESAELIIEGEAVSPPIMKRSKKYRSLECLLLLIATLLTALMTFLLTRYSQKKSLKAHGLNLQPSFPPTISSSPTDLYEEYMKQLVIPISGKDVLEDESSIQYFVMKHLALRLADSSNFTELSAMERKIIQGYVILVSTFSLIDPLPHIYKQALEDMSTPSFPFSRICKAFTCNENGDITIFASTNGGWHRSGGILTREIGELKSLTYIILTNNNLRGTIPTEIGKLKNLKCLELSENGLSGKIPTEIGQLENLEVAFLNSNNFNSSVPSEIGNLNELFYLDLSQNSLTGSLPAKIYNMSRLEGLLLWNNSLSGDIDYFCEKNLTAKVFSRKIIDKDLITYTLSGELGFVGVDCDDRMNITQCICCKCFD